MAGFRVNQHQRWRSRAQRPIPRGPSTRSGRPRPPTPAQTPEAGHTVEIERLDARVRALGPLAWPARAFDLLFGSWQSRRTGAFAVRFLLVSVALGLFIGGAFAETPIVYETGDYRTITPATVVDTYVAENSVHVLPIQVTSTTGRTSAWFTDENGRVDVRHLGENQEVHAFKVRLVRKDPNLNPVLLLTSPGGSPHSLAPQSDDGISVTYPPIPIEQAGRWQFIVHTNRGLGHVEMHIAVSRAPLDPVEMPDLKAVQIAGGAGVFALLLGAYSPGARPLRERRRLERAAEDAEWLRPGAPSLAPTTGFARMTAGRTGAHAGEPPGQDVPEELAEGQGKGWIVRTD